MNLKLALFLKAFSSEKLSVLNGKIINNEDLLKTNLSNEALIYGVSFLNMNIVLFQNVKETSVNIYDHNFNLIEKIKIKENTSFKYLKGKLKSLKSEIEKANKDEEKRFYINVEKEVRKRRILDVSVNKKGLSIFAWNFTIHCSEIENSKDLLNLDICIYNEGVYEQKIVLKINKENYDYVSVGKKLVNIIDNVSNWETVYKNALMAFEKIGLKNELENKVFFPRIRNIVKVIGDLGEIYFKLNKNGGLIKYDLTERKVYIICNNIILFDEELSMINNVRAEVEFKNIVLNLLKN